MPQAAVANMSIGTGVCTVCRATVPVIIKNGSPTTKILNCPAARVTDMVTDPAGHVGIITVGSIMNSIDNLQQAYVGSQFSGVVTGIITTGVPIEEIGI